MDDINALTRKITSATPEQHDNLWKAVAKAESVESKVATRLKKNIKVNRNLYQGVQKLKADVEANDTYNRRFQRILMTEAQKGLKCNPNWGTTSTVSFILSIIH